VEPASRRGDLELWDFLECRDQNRALQQSEMAYYAVVSIWDLHFHAKFLLIVSDKSFIIVIFFTLRL
jgi:hypothetical protein